MVRAAKGPGALLLCARVKANLGASDASLILIRKSEEWHGLASSIMVSLHTSQAACCHAAVVVVNRLFLDLEPSSHFGSTEAQDLFSEWVLGIVDGSGHQPSLSVLQAFWKASFCAVSICGPLELRLRRYLHSILDASSSKRGLEVCTLALSWKEPTQSWSAARSKAGEKFGRT